MRRYLVVAHQTLSSPELVEALMSRAKSDEATFHLLVPIYHAESGLTWTEGHDRGIALRHLDEALARLTAAGLTATPM